MTDEQRALAKQRFLEAYAESGIVLRASKAAGVHNSLVYQWKQSDPEFVAAMHLADEIANDVIREEIHRRAIEGTEKPVFYQGEECGLIREYSDALLAKMATARLPEYRTVETEKRGRFQPNEAEGEKVEHEVHVTFEVVEDWRKVSRPS